MNFMSFELISKSLQPFLIEINLWLLDLYVFSLIFLVFFSLSNSLDKALINSFFLIGFVRKSITLCSKLFRAKFGFEVVKITFGL